ncbi:hypothetical protein AVEN_27931-1 [Araneus ventricosus]|uniref:Uncharacterized protein n=1 Tax=Araneus ventricosus TaxID=182803 RepID=A0A4Y2IKJ7_ARAVE|nr:hypothetical protein AVEN_27931-1 [Araneus ventricosus]
MRSEDKEPASEPASTPYRGTCRRPPHDGFLGQSDLDHAALRSRIQDLIPDYPGPMLEECSFDSFTYNKIHSFEINSLGQWRHNWGKISLGTSLGGGGKGAPKIEYLLSIITRLNFSS